MYSKKNPVLMIMTSYRMKPLHLQQAHYNKDIELTDEATIKLFPVVDLCKSHLEQL